MMSDEDARTLEELERRLITLLPEEYRETYEEVEPVSMGSAGIVYAGNGQVAWNAMWASFCDLALAGGPPHKGTLLEPASPSDIDAAPERYASVVAEICRGIALVTRLEAAVSPDPGWVRVRCDSAGMAGWLLRTITVENVAVRAEAADLDLPAGPEYRIDKEIKNVITAIAKGTHYWLEHMSLPEWRAIGGLLEGMNDESPLIEPWHARAPLAGDSRQALTADVAATILQNTGLRRAERVTPGWLGLECTTVRAAVWMMRMLVAANVLARREKTALFVPINPAVDPEGTILADSVTLVHRLAVGRGLF